MRIVKYCKLLNIEKCCRLDNAARKTFLAIKENPQAFKICNFLEKQLFAIYGDEIDELTLNDFLREDAADMIREGLGLNV